MTTPTSGQMKERCRAIRELLNQAEENYRYLHMLAYDESPSGSGDAKVRVVAGDPTGGSAISRGSLRGTLRWMFRKMGQVEAILEKVVADSDKRFGPDEAPSRMSGDTRIHPETMGSLVTAQGRRRQRGED